MGDKALTAIICFLLLLSLGIQTIDMAKANPLPPIDPKIVIENPQNAMYITDTITFNFTAASNWGVYSCYYSLNGGDMQPIDNLTIVSQEDINIGKNPRVDRTTVRGSVVISGLADGWHNMTIYQVYQYESNENYDNYKTGDIMSSASIAFLVESLITKVAVSGVAIAVAIIVILLYVRHRNSFIQNYRGVGAYG